jgi:uncharacterized protein HemX
MAIFTAIGAGFAILKNLKYIKMASNVIGPFIGKHKVKLIMAIIIILAVVGLYWYVTGLQNDVEHWKKEYNDQVTKTAVIKERCQTNMTTLEGAIATQNAEIERVAGLLTKAEADLDAKIKEAAKKQQKFSKEIEKIRNDVKPETCDGAIKYLIDGAGELSW